MHAGPLTKPLDSAEGPEILWPFNNLGTPERTCCWGGKHRTHRQNLSQSSGSSWQMPRNWRLPYFPCNQELLLCAPSVSTRSSGETGHCWGTEGQPHWFRDIYDTLWYSQHWEGRLTGTGCFPSPTLDLSLLASFRPAFPSHSPSIYWASTQPTRETQAEPA